MDINKNNYEAYLLDLWEGNLSEDQKSMLFSFLENHPELEESDALSLLDDVSDTAPTDLFDKEAISFESINKKNHEFFFIAYFEGDLSQSEMTGVDNFVKENPELAKKFDQFKRAQLPVEEITYPNKKTLLPDSTPIVSIQARTWLTGLAAASLALFFWLTNPFQNAENKYSMDGQTEIKTNIHQAHPFEIANTEKVDKKASVESIYTPKTVVTELKKNTSKGQQENQNESKEEVPHNESDPKMRSISRIKADQLSSVVASLNPKSSDKEITNSKNKVNTKEEVPTILELTTAYLQRKNVLNDERKPDLKSILNNTLTAVNENEEPVLATNDESNVKRTVFQLGSFKVERIAQK